MSSANYDAVGRTHTALNRVTELRNVLQLCTEGHVPGASIVEQLRQAVRVPMDMLPITSTHPEAVDILISTMAVELEAMRVFATQMRLERAGGGL